MLASMETYLRRGQRKLKQWALDPGVQAGGRVMAYGGSGFFLSAASLGNFSQPLTMGLICALTGWRAMAVSLGSMVGYGVFWGAAGIQGVFWALAAGLLSLFLGKRQEIKEQPALLWALCAFLTASIGLLFQVLWQDDTPLLTYFLRVALSGASGLLFYQVLRQRDGITDWIAGAVAVLALAQAAPVPFLSLGCVAAGFIAVGSAFPAAALAGLGMDLAQVTPLPMTAVLCAAYYFRLIPFSCRWMRYASPALACLTVMALCSIWDFMPLPGLLLGGWLGMLMPPKPQTVHHRGPTGIAQVRLEMAAGLMARTGELLRLPQEPPVDQEALFRQARDRACGSCTARNTCREQEKLTSQLLQNPLAFTCRKSGRIQGELARSREQLRRIRADRQRRQEYNRALVQQYQFLAEYLRRLADQLPRRGERIKASFTVQVSARTRGKERANGDTCMAFPGPGCRYYVLLCDGMGTGLGAEHAGGTAGNLVRQLLTAGFPAEHAFRSVNSMLALGDQAGLVTLDLAEIRLDTGKVAVYKWGAAPSWLLRRGKAEKIGTATPPPGISIAEARETVARLSLRGGEALILVSDGVEAGEVLRRGDLTPDAPPGELAERLLEGGSQGGEDDATAAVIRLRPGSMAT